MQVSIYSVIISFNVYDNLVKEVLHYSHFADEEIEAQRGKAIV